MSTFRRILYAVVFAPFAALSIPAEGESIRIEAEDTLATHDISGIPIRIHASGFLLEGLDWEDEWVEYAFSVSDYGMSRFWIKCRATLGAENRFLVAFTGNQSGTSQSVFVDFTGNGFP